MRMKGLAKRGSRQAPKAKAPSSVGALRWFRQREVTARGLKSCDWRLSGGKERETTQSHWLIGTRAVKETLEWGRLTTGLARTHPPVPPAEMQRPRRPAKR
eukprot:gene8201-375_t